MEEKRDGEKKKKRKKKKRKKEESSEGMEILKFCMDSMIFGMDITWKVRILWFCMQF